MTRQMVDSAWPLKTQPTPIADIVLIYAGGDTPHPYTAAEIAAQPNRYRWPCWVRSNPSQVSAPLEDAPAFIKWLQDHDVPKGTCVVLDLEMAVDAHYVNGFNLALRDAGYKTTKYGSRSTIWKNPQTDGGTFVAWPDHPDDFSGAIGDTVAIQYKFAGGYDLSVVKGQADLPLWDTKPPGPYRHVVAAGNTQTIDQLAAQRGTTISHLAEVTVANTNPEHLAIWTAYLALRTALKVAGLHAPVLPVGLVYWTSNK